MSRYCTRLWHRNMTERSCNPVTLPRKPASHTQSIANMMLKGLTSTIISLSMHAENHGKHLYMMTTKDVMKDASLNSRILRSCDIWRTISVTSVSYLPDKSSRMLYNITGRLIAASNHLPLRSSKAVRAACSAYSGICSRRKY